MKPVNPRLAALRAQKAALLPRAAALAGAGRSYQEIATTLGVAKSTVCSWLRDQPLGRAAARSLATPRMTARLAARYESLYHRAVREWNRSRTDRRTESVVTIVPADGCPTTKTTVRTEPRIGNAACLGKALAATQALEGLHRRERARQESLASDAAGNADGLTRTVKTRTTPSGRVVRTVVTTRSDAGRVAALRELQETLDEKCRARETHAAIRAVADAAEEELQDADTGSARSANAGTAGMPSNRRKSLLANELRLPGGDFASVSRSATLPNYVELHIIRLM